MAKLKVQAKEQDLGETLIAPKSELVSFIDSIPDLKLSQKEKDAFIQRYIVIPAVIP